MKKFLPLLLFPLLFAVGSFSYYGGQTLNHGHTSAAGDGGPLTNPVISGTGTLQGLTVSTVVVREKITVLSSEPVRAFAFEARAGGGYNNDRVRYGFSNQTGGLGVEAANGNIGMFGDGYTSSNPIMVWTASRTIVGNSSTLGSTDTIVPRFDNQFGLGNATERFVGIYLSSGIFGITNGLNAPTGFVGEYISSKTVSGATGKSATGTGQWFDIVSATVTAGDWDISGIVCGTANGATVTEIKSGISSTANNSGSGLTDGDNAFYSPDVPSGSSDSCQSIPSWRVTPTVQTIYYLKAQMSYTVATPKGYGRISARRIR